MRYIRFTDPVLKSLRRSYTRSKCQAKYRGQTWNIEFEEYLEIWRVGEEYLKPGRGKSDFHLGRKDITKGWSVDNVQVLNRGQHLSERMLKQYEK